MFSAMRDRDNAWRAYRLAYPPDAVCRLGGLNHLDLLGHPRVYAQLRRWLVERPEGPHPA